MGDPKFPKRSYDSPSHPWEGERISNEAELVKRYGLKNKKELWKAQSVLRGLRRQSRNLQARLRYGDQQAQLETDKLLQRCGRLGYLPMQGGSLDDVLALDMESVLGRRLQTIVKQKRLASTFREARQMITHGHIFVEGRKVTIPGYVTTRSEEGKIDYNPRSPFSDDLHPTRV
ncbi:MAG: 30S ribosomal protein S4, partial [Thermoplasmatota archaeon]